MNYDTFVEYFEGKPVEFLKDEKGEIYITAKEIGTALGYKDPKNKIEKIFNMFTGFVGLYMGELETITPQGKEYIYIFKNFLVLLILERINTAKAHRFSLWTKKIMDTEAQNKEPKPPENLPVPGNKLETTENPGKAIVEYFEGQPVEFIEDKDGELWLTGETLGKALGYSEPGKSIRNLFNRHKNILEQFSINLMRNSTGRPTRGFNETGCNIIAMKANTEKSNQFVIWVAHVLTELRHGRIVDISALKRELEENRKLLDVLVEKVSALEARPPALPAEQKQKAPVLTAGVIREINKMKDTRYMWLKKLGFPVPADCIVKERIAFLKDNPQHISYLMGYECNIYRMFLSLRLNRFKEKEKLAKLLNCSVEDIWGETAENVDSINLPEIKYEGLTYNDLSSLANALSDTWGNISIKDCQQIFNKSTSTIYSWIKQGKLEQSPFGEKIISVSLNSILKYIDSGFE